MPPPRPLLLPRDTVVPVSEVTKYFPDVTKEASTGPNETSVGKPIASRSVVFTSADGKKKVTVSVDQYASASDAAAAYQTAVQGSKAAPGFNPAATPSLGQEAFAGTSQVGAEMHFGLGARDGRLIMSATHAGDIPVTPDNSNNLISLGARSSPPPSRSSAPRGAVSSGEWLLGLAHAAHLATSRSHAFAGQFARLLHPGGELSFVELVVLVDVEVAHVLLLGRAGRDRRERRAAEESHLHVLREAMEAEEPDLVLDAIEGRVPFDRLAHAGDGARDERVEAAPDVAFPARHGGDVGLHRGVAVALRDLRVAAREKGRLRGHPLGGRLPRDLRRLLGRLVDHAFTRRWLCHTQLHTQGLGKHPRCAFERS